MFNKPWHLPTPLTPACCYLTLCILQYDNMDSRFTEWVPHRVTRSGVSTLGCICVRCWIPVICFAVFSEIWLDCLPCNTWRKINQEYSVTSLKLFSLYLFKPISQNWRQPGQCIQNLIPYFPCCWAVQLGCVSRLPTQYAIVNLRQSCLKLTSFRRCVVSVTTWKHFSNTLRRKFFPLYYHISRQYLSTDRFQIPSWMRTWWRCILLHRGSIVCT